MKENTCCFTGHRSVPGGKRSSLEKQTAEIVEELMKKGVNEFICGGATGYDMMAAFVVIKEKQKHPEVKLTVAIPCDNQEKYFSESDKKKYEEILEAADETVYTSHTYNSGCMHKRNRYMVDNSAHIIAYCIKESGGSYYTLSYAANSGIKIYKVM